jgi:uncharacterized protein
MKATVMRFMFGALAGACLFSLAPVRAEPPEFKVAGNWLGAIPIPSGQLRVVFRISEGPGGQLTAMMDSPDQQTFDVPVDQVICTKRGLRLEVQALPGRYEGVFTAEDTIDGKLIQGNDATPLPLKRVDTVPLPPKRPQTPKQPFPYQEQEVVVDNAVAGVKLAGTLTLPRGQGPFPAVILLTGSGPQNRDEMFCNHRPYLVLADHLTRKGFAVLRTDDRGIGQSTGDFGAATMTDFTGDALACIKFLKSRPEIKPKAIGLLGHSEGAGVAMMAAAQSSDVAFIMMMAGVGIKGYDNMVLQDYLSAKQAGASETEAEWIRQWVKKFYRVPLQEKDNAVAEAKLQAMYAAISPEEKAAARWMGGITLDPKYAVSPPMRMGLAFDPIPLINRFKCPVLALNGDKDVQVPATENLQGLTAAFKAAGNSRVVIKKMANLNHLFQTVLPGGPTDYCQIEETFAPAALAEISDWLKTNASGL